VKRRTFAEMELLIRESNVTIRMRSVVVQPVRWMQGTNAPHFWVPLRSVGSVVTAYWSQTSNATTKIKLAAHSAAKWIQASLVGDLLHQPVSETTHTVGMEFGKWQSPVMMGTNL
jgi:uncharacterized protein (DUF736 family)